ncbi:Nitric oxide reductase subunit C [Geodia barretti]|uniref:Nitric oxide reductase subunit C n=1 Tax=Geodia barretti TaxID=519541 RepID=A0AA35X0H0_GEOBA|nr:Nitric oxide reductase subunit C [Geodia barretti]
MLSKSAARAFFLVGTIGFSVIFLLLTFDTIRRVPEQTNADNLTPQAIAGKHLWDRNNCMGCHTILGEGAYYAPELTKVYERRGPEFIKAMLRDPEAMYPGQRRMVKYDFTDEEMEAMVAFLKWIGEMDLNGFPPEAHPAAGDGADGGAGGRCRGFAPAQGVQPNLHRLP